jgi:exopolyphosphatase/guanosine-5'-triphosphate,3'-diphosphate pyrophosphatase
MNYIIDIGSNSIRMGTPQWVPSLRELRTTQLSEGLEQSGMLCEAAMVRSLDALAELTETARKAGGTVYAFATEAVRAAANGKAFCARVRAAAGIDVDVLTPAAEARCGFFGAVGTGRGIAVDIGGASAEVAYGERGALQYAKSLPVGAVRLTEYACGDLARLQARIAAAVEGYGAIQPMPVYGIGGTPSGLYVIKTDMKQYDPVRVHGGILTLSEIKGLADLLWTTPPAVIGKRYPLIAPRRLKVLPAAAYLLAAILEHIGADRIEISELDNIEGYAVEKGLLVAGQ